MLELISTPEELSGFLNWGIEGLKRLREQGGFSNAASTEAIREMYLKLSSPIGAFVVDELEVSPESVVVKEDMYEAFLDYCEEQNIPTVSKDKFGKNFNQYAKKARGDRKRVNGTSQRVWLGYRLLTTPLSTTDGKLDLEEIDMTK